MKKVFLCIPSLATGGAEKFVVDLATRINRAIYEVVVVETRYDVDSPFKRLLQNKGVRIVDLSDKSFLKMNKKQVSFFKKEKPDIVHANIGSVLHIMLSSWLCGIPKRIYTVHNEAYLLYKGNKFKRLAYKAAFGLFGFIPVAICPTVKETLIDRLGIRDCKIPVVNNGVDISAFNPGCNNLDLQDVRLISVGSLYWIKNQELIIRTVVDLHSTGMNVSLTLIGDGEDREKLKSIIKEENAEAYIHLVGRKNNVADYLKDSNIYVSASSTEGLPLSVLEAMACGLPVIATKAGGIKDIVRDGENGYLFDFNDREMLKECICRLCYDKEAFSTFSLNSRLIAEQWSIEKCVSGYEHLYEGKN